MEHRGQECTNGARSESETSASSSTYIYDKLKMRTYICIYLKSVLYFSSKQMHRKGRSVGATRWEPGRKKARPTLPPPPTPPSRPRNRKRLPFFPDIYIPTSSYFISRFDTLRTLFPCPTKLLLCTFFRYGCWVGWRNFCPRR